MFPVPYGAGNYSELSGGIQPMPILVPNLRISLQEAKDADALEGAAVRCALARMRISENDLREGRIFKKSIDARGSGSGAKEPTFVVSVYLTLDSPAREEHLAARRPEVTRLARPALEFSCGSEPLPGPIYIAGFGPAGMFAALLLARAGYRPIVLERGGPLEERVKAVERFWTGGAFSSDTNVQFGEGGAGTFSDGKLTTRISDPRCRYVLEEFVQHGAPAEILCVAKPHIGTDELRHVITSLRQEILNCGGEIRFHTRLDEVGLRNGRLRSLVADGNEEAAGILILAVGHSARDTFGMLQRNALDLNAKPFSVGVRIEQLQTVIDQGLYGPLAGDPRLPAGEYQLSHRRKDGRCVYTFCMCPGGYVVPAASSEDTVVTNGMSYHARNGRNANAALVVSVEPSDFGSADPLAGMRFQETLERRAFSMGGGSYAAPAMTVDGFMRANRTSGLVLGDVEPTYALGVTAGDFDALFPSTVTEMLRTGLHVFDQKLHGFSRADGILTGVETRTSSPVRILRSAETLEALLAEGVYPCGEGAGYAGGIMSAAVDGIRAAQAILGRFAPPK